MKYSRSHDGFFFCVSAYVMWAVELLQFIFLSNCIIVLRNVGKTALGFVPCYLLLFSPASPYGIFQLLMYTHENWFDLDSYGTGRRHSRYLFMKLPDVYWLKCIGFKCSCVLCVRVHIVILNCVLLGTAHKFDISLVITWTPNELQQAGSDR